MGALVGGRSRSRVVQLGLLALLVGSVLFILAIRASRALLATPIPPFSLPSPAVPVPLLPEPGHFESADAIAAWRRELVRGLVYLVVVLAYYGGYAGVVFGVLSVVSVVVLSRDHRVFVRACKRLITDSFVKTALLIVALLWGVLLNPWVWPIAVELFVVVTVGGSVFALLATLTLEVYRQEGTLVRVLIAYPLAIGTLVLPLVAAGLASPTFARMLRNVTRGLAIFLLDTILVVGGVSTFLREQFQLTGIAYFATWVGVIIVLGWLLGGTAVAIGRLRERGI